MPASTVFCERKASTCYHAMRLAAKLVLLFLVGLLLIVGLFAFLTIEQDRRLAMAEHQRHASDLAATLQPSIEEAIRERKTGELAESLTRSTARLQHVRVRWVEFSSRGDQSRRPSVPREMIVMQREVTTVSMPDPTGQDRLYTYVPIDTDEPGGGGEAIEDARIEVSAPDMGASDRVRRSLLSSLFALLGVAALSGIVVLVGGFKMVGQPLEKLIAKVHRVGQGDFESPVELGTHDELGRLGVALNEMCDQLAQQCDQIQQEAASRVAAVEQLRHAERLSMVGRMAAGIAHEIGTPLNVVSGRAELIASGELSAEASRESAEAIRGEAQRITKIVRELLDFARQSTPHRSVQSLNTVIDSTANLMQPLLASHHAELKVELPKSRVDAFFDSGQIQQVLTNLIINAAQSTSDAGRITICLDPQSTEETHPDGGKPGLYARIQIRDNGIGIAPEDLPHIFEPFFTTKEVGQGTGLGLSISHGIVSEHNGWIDVASTLGEGSSFTIHLPVAEAQE